MTKVQIVHQGRGGYIQIDDFKYEIEMKANPPPSFLIYFPMRKIDRKISDAKKELEKLIKKEPEKWELDEYEKPHGFYGGMTVNERLYVSGLLDIYEKAEKVRDIETVRLILHEVELGEENINTILSKY